MDPGSDAARVSTPRGGGALVTPAARPLPQSFETWVSLSPDAEVLALLRIVTEALARRGYVPTVAYAKPA